MPGVVTGSVFKMFDQGYGGDNIHVSCDEIEDPRQSAEGGGEVDTGHQVCQGINVQYSVLSLGRFDLSLLQGER